MNEREEFESKCRERFPNISLKRYDSDLVARDFGSEEGDYCAPMARDLWAGYQWAWQAATEQRAGKAVAYGVFYCGVMQDWAWSEDSAKEIAETDYPGCKCTTEPLYTKLPVKK